MPTKTKLTLDNKAVLLRQIAGMLSEYVPALAAATVKYDRKAHAFAVRFNAESDMHDTVYASYADMLIWLGCVALTKHLAHPADFDETVEIAVRNSLAERG